MARRKRKRKSDPTRFSKKVVAAVLVAVVIFTVAMVVVYIKTGGVPDTLVTAFFAFAGGEAGALGLIRFGKAKYEKHTSSQQRRGRGASGGIGGHNGHEKQGAGREGR